MLLFLLLLAQLHGPAAAGDLKEIRRLVEADRASLEVRDSAGHTPLAMAVAAGQRKAVALLLELGARADEPEPLILAAQAGNLELARMLIAGKGNPNLTFGEPPRSAIYYAIESGRKAMVNLLADNGTDLDKALPGVGAPLHWAAERGTPEIMLALLNPPVNVRLETRDDAGRTALQRAVLAGRVEAARLLLNYGAEPLDSLELSRQSGNPAMIKLMESPPQVKPGHREIKIRM